MIPSGTEPAGAAAPPQPAVELRKTGPGETAKTVVLLTPVSHNSTASTTMMNFSIIIRKKGLTLYRGTARRQRQQSGLGQRCRPPLVIAAGRVSFAFFVQLRPAVMTTLVSREASKKAGD